MRYRYTIDFQILTAHSCCSLDRVPIYFPLLHYGKRLHGRAVAHSALDFYWECSSSRCDHYCQPHKCNCMFEKYKLHLAYFWKLLIFTFFYISRRKYWFRANFRFPVFDGFTRFGMSWTRFDYFWKMCVCVSVCVWQKFCGKCRSRTYARNFMKLYI